MVYSKLVHKINAEILLYTISLLLLLIVLMLPSNPMDRLPGQDNGVFLYGGQQVLIGQIPYQDFWDHKGPLIYYIDALGLSLASGSRWGVWLLEFVFLTLTALGLFRIADSLWGRSFGLIVFGIWYGTMFLVGPYQHFRDSNYTETYALLFNVWSIVFWLLAFRSPRQAIFYFLIGILAGLSFALRPNNVATQIAIGVAEVIMAFRPGQWRYRIKNIALLIGGASVVLGIFLFWFWVWGALSKFVDAVITYNLAYSRKNLAYHTGLNVFITGVSRLVWLPVIAYLLLIFLPLSSSKFQRKEDQREIHYFLLIGWPLEVLFTVLSGRALLHYYILWTPYACLLPAVALAMLLGSSLESFKAKLEKTIRLLGLLMVIGMIAVWGSDIWSFMARLLSTPLQTRSSNVLITYIEENTSQSEKVLVWGNDVWINFLSNRRSPTRFAYQYPLFLKGYSNPAMIYEFLMDLDGRPPSLIVEPVVDTDEIAPLNRERRSVSGSTLELPEGMEQVFEFVEANYCVDKIIGDVLVYKNMTANQVTGRCQQSSP